MGNTIKQLREEQRMTQLRLSVELEVSQETISAYESGKNYPNVTNLIKLSEILHASCDYILGLSDVRFPSASNQLDLDASMFLERYQRLDFTQKEKLKSYLDGLLDN